MPARGEIAEYRARLLRGAFAAERRAHADDNDRQDRAAERSQRRQPPCLKPDRRSDVDAVAAREPGQQPLACAGQDARAEQQENVPLGARAPCGLRQRRRLVGAPGEALHLLQKRRQKRRADPGGDARQDDGEPESAGARLSERGRNLVASRDRLFGHGAHCPHRSERVNHVGFDATCRIAKPWAFEWRLLIPCSAGEAQESTCYGA